MKIKILILISLLLITGCADIEDLPEQVCLEQGYIDSNPAVQLSQGACEFNEPNQTTINVSNDTIQEIMAVI